MWLLMWLFLCGHSLADTALQPDSMAKGKRRSTPINMDKVPAGQKPLRLWYMWITHHALIQGLIVTLAVIIAGLVNPWLLQFWWLGIVEFGTHCIIDFAKSEGAFCPRVDQTLHLLCKVGYLVVICY